MQEMYRDKSMVKQREKSLRGKVILFMIAVLAVGFSIIAVSMVNTGRTTMSKIIGRSLQDTTLLYEQIINNSVQSELEFVASIAKQGNIVSALERYQKGELTYEEKVEIQTEFEVRMEGYENKEGIFLVSSSGYLILDNTSPQYSNINLSDRDYVYRTIATRSGVTSEFIISEATGEQTICFTAPVINREGDFLGFVGSSIYIGDIIQELLNVSLYGTQTTAPWIYDQNGTIIAHKHINNVGKVEQNPEIVQIIEENQEGKLRAGTVGIVPYEQDGVVLETRYVPIEGTEWLLFVGVDYDEILHGYLKEFKVSVAVTSIVVLILIIIVYRYFIMRLIDPLIKITRMMSVTRELDLSEIHEKGEFDSELKRNDELGRLAEAILSVRDKFRRVIRHINENTKMLRNNMLDVSSNMEKIYQNSQDNMQTIQELYAGLEETSAITQEVSASVNEVNSGIDEIRELTSKSTETTQQIQQKVNEIDHKNENRAKAIREESHDIGESLNDSIKKATVIDEVNQLTESIKKITDQVDLLALNAAIEAARAGEHGRGFGVVASEIRKLSIESSENVEEVERVLKQVVAAIENLKSSSEEALSFIDIQIGDMVEDVNSIVTEYKEDADTTQQITVDIMKKLDVIWDHAENMQRGAGEIADTATNNAVGASVIAEKTTNITENILEVKSLAERTTEDSKTVNKLIEEFTV